MLKPVRLLAECYDKHFAFLIYVQLKAIIDRLHTSVRNDFKVKKLVKRLPDEESKKSLHDESENLYACGRHINLLKEMEKKAVVREVIYE